MLKTLGWRYLLHSSFHFCSYGCFALQAKLAMMGSRRTMLMMNGMYVPFGALMLVMYDKALLNTPQLKRSLPQATSQD